MTTGTASQTDTKQSGARRESRHKLKTHWHVRDRQMKMSQERTPKRKGHRCNGSGKARQDRFKKETINREVSLIRKPVR